MIKVTDQNSGRNAGLHAGLPGRLLFAPGEKGVTIPREAFEIEAGAFLEKRLAARVFLDTCNLALGSYQGRTYEHLVYKYRFLAHMELGLYYEALSDAIAVLKKCRDELMHYQMMCSIYLRRNNYRTALEYVERAAEAAARLGGDAEDYAAERENLTRYLEGIVSYTAVQLCRRARREGPGFARAMAGRPVHVSGRATFCLDPESNAPYLVFPAGPGRPDAVYCRAAASEIPFIRHITGGRPACLFGHVLGADERGIILFPANHVD